MFTNLSFALVCGKIFHSGFKYRDRASIIGDILSSINSDPKGKTKTSIMRGAKLSLEQTNKYLDLLLLCDVIRAANPLSSQENARYRLTVKGCRLIRDFEMWRYAFDVFYHQLH